MSVDGAGDGTGGVGMGALQFDNVEHAAGTVGGLCGRCARGIRDEYFSLGGGMLCRSCADQAGGGQGGIAPLLRALAFGAGAAVLGTLIWFVIMKVTDHEFGLIAIGIGVLVGMGVRKGARGRGGWKYQTLAMALTYVSITSAYVPLVIKGLAGGPTAQPAAAGPQAAAPGPEASAVEAPAPAPKPAPSVAEIVLAFAVVFGVAFASPFLAGASNFMGIIIIGIALYEAWKMNRRIPIGGPFRFGSAGAPAVAPSPSPSPSSAGAPPPPVVL